MHLTVYGEVEDVEILREDGERYVAVRGSKSGRFRLDPTHDGFEQLIDALERAQPEDNAFRREPDPEQSSLVDFTLEESSEGSDDGDVWDGIAVEADRLEITEPALEPGEGWNQNDPAKW